MPLKAKFLQGYYDTPAIERLDYGTDVSRGDGRRRQEGQGVPRKGHPAADDGRGQQLVPRLQLAGPGRRQGHDARAGRAQSQAAPGAVDRHRLGGARRDLRARPGRGRAGPAAAVAVRLSRGRAVGVQSGGLPQGAGRQAVRRSLDEAKKLLAEAGYPDGRDATTGKPLVLNFDYQQSRRRPRRRCSTGRSSSSPRSACSSKCARPTTTASRTRRTRVSPDLLLGLARRLSGRREFPVHALRPQRQGADQRQRREHGELPEPGVRQAVREDEIPRRRPAEAEAHRPDDRDRAERRRLELRLLSQVRGGVSPVGRQRQADADHPQPHRLPAPRSRAAHAQARRMEPAGLVADSADPDRADRGHRAGVVCLAPARTRDRGAHAGRRAGAAS